MATTSGTGNWISHDGAEERIEYNEADDKSYPSDLEIKELYPETVSKTHVGHTRSEYSVEALSETGRKYEITLTESGDPGFGSIVRATPVEDESVVYHARSNLDPGLLVSADETLNGEVLERSY